MRHTTWIIAFGLVFAGFTASAGESVLSPVNIDPSLKGLSFGMSKAELVSLLQRRIHERYGAIIRDTLDVRDRDSLSKRRDVEVDAVGKSITKFDGTESGWNVSLIRNEFETGLGEEMVHQLDGQEHLYFFFTKDRLYKAIRTVLVENLTEMLAKMTNIYGKPKTEQFESERLLSAVWQSEKCDFRIDNQERMYQCFTLKWVNRALDEEVQAVWQKARDGGPRMNPLVEAAKEGQESNPKASEKDPVDDLLGD